MKHECYYVVLRLVICVSLWHPWPYGGAVTT